MKEIATIHFTDDGTGDEAVAVVSADQGRVRRTLSLRNDGDVMVVMRLTDCQQLRDALRKAEIRARED